MTDVRSFSSGLRMTSLVSVRLHNLKREIRLGLQQITDLRSDLKSWIRFEKLAGGSSIKLHTLTTRYSFWEVILVHSQARLVNSEKIQQAFPLYVYRETFVNNTCPVPQQLTSAGQKTLVQIPFIDFYCFEILVDLHRLAAFET